MELKPTNALTNPEPAKPTTDTGQAKDNPIDLSHMGAVPDSAAKAHYRSDVDSSMQSLHHSLGTNRTQASPGNHIHDGITSPKLGTKKFNTVAGHEGEIINQLSISGAKGGNAALASVIALLKNFVDFDDNTTA